MGIREKINKSENVVKAAAASVIVISLLFIIWQATKGRSSRSAAALTKAFYSDDDGKTWFVDDGQKIVPFDHDGKPAVRARVFRCKDGGLFVAYLEQYGDAIKSRILAAAAQHPGDAAPDFSLMPMDVKKPGERKWLSMGTSNASASEYARITTPICPRGGNEGLSPVSPADPDNGASN